MVWTKSLLDLSESLKLRKTGYATFMSLGKPKLFVVLKIRKIFALKLHLKL